MSFCAIADVRNAATWWNCDRSGTTSRPPTFGIEYTIPSTPHWIVGVTVAAPPRVSSWAWVSQSTSQVRFVAAVWAKIAPIRLIWSAAIGTKNSRSNV